MVTVLSHSLGHKPLLDSYRASSLAAETTSPPRRVGRILNTSDRNGYIDRLRSAKTVLKASKPERMINPYSVKVGIDWIIAS